MEKNMVKERIQTCKTAVWPTDTVALAAEWARYWHSGQIRKNDRNEEKIDYFWGHVYEVYRILHEELNVQEEEVLVTALLHDTLEDTALTPEQIGRWFGADVLENVRFLTRKKGQTFSEYARHLMQQGNGAVVLVKLVDRFQNLTTILTVSNLAWVKKKLVQTDKDILSLVWQTQQRLFQQGDVRYLSAIQIMAQRTAWENEQVKRKLAQDSFREFLK